MQQQNTTTLDLDLGHIYRPSSLTEKAPLLVLLHGYGSNKEDLFGFADYLSPELSILALEAPIVLGPERYAWYDIYFEPSQGKWSDATQAQRVVQRILANIESAIKQINADATRLSLLGFSQGSILSLALGLEHHKLAKNIIVLSGYINHDIFELPKNLTPKLGPKIFMSHGSQDQVIPLAWAQESRDFLMQHQYDLTYREFPVGHGVNPENFAALKAFLDQNA